jgi:hypothetical protein
MTLRPLDGNPLLAERERLGPLERDDPVRQRLVRRYAYGIPTDEVLDAIAAASPGGVVELGAGTGYWARLLHDRSVDVVAFDVAPSADGHNLFVDDAEAWFPVRRGDADTVAAHAHRTLLLVWPTWNETWAGDAAADFHAVGGEWLVYVGEGPGGLTGDPTLHARLGIHGPCLACRFGLADVPCVCGIDALWEVTATLAVPRWGGAEDDCRILRRIDQPRRAALVASVGGRRQPRDHRRHRHCRRGEPPVAARAGATGVGVLHLRCRAGARDPRRPARRPYVGVSLETYTGIIGTVLAGIAVGSALGRWAADRQDPRALLGPLLVASGAASLPSLPSLPIIAALGPGVAAIGGGPAGIVTLAVTGFVLPAALLSAVAPMAAKLRLASTARTGIVVGGLPAARIPGELVGTFATGFVLVAAWPTRPIVFAIGSALIAAGLALTVVLRRRPAWVRRIQTPR